MAHRVATPRSRRPTGRPRGRPPGSTTGARAARDRGVTVSGLTASEPPPKKRRYVPGGPGGGGRYLEITADDESTPSASARTSRTSRPAAPVTPAAPSSIPFPARERSTRSRNPVRRPQPDEMRYSSAAAVAAAVVQSEGYKPREERGMGGVPPQSRHRRDLYDPPRRGCRRHRQVGTRDARHRSQDATLNRSSTPINHIKPASTGNTPNPQSAAAVVAPLAIDFGTPSRRRGRPPREPVSFHARASDLTPTPRTPRVLPIHNQTPKERLDLKLPSFRKTDRILLFESKTFGQARYVDKG